MLCAAPARRRGCYANCIPAKCINCIHKQLTLSINASSVRAMSENPKHYTSETPCKKCRRRIRYVTTDNCVPCAKAAVRKRREAAIVEQLVAENGGPFDCLDDGSDLL